MSNELSQDKNKIEPINTEQHPPKQSQLAEFFEQLNAIPWVSFWSLSLTIGGLLLLSYFSSIEYLPDLDVSAISLTIVGIAAIGTFIVLILGFGLILPTLYVDASDDKKQKFYLVVQAIAGISLGVSVISFFSYSFEKKIWAWSILLFLFSVVSAFTKKRPVLLNFFKNLGREVLWGTWAITGPLLYYKILAPGGEKDWMETLSPYLFTFVFAMVSILLAYVSAKSRAVARFIAAICAVFGLSMAVQRPALVSQASVAALGLSQRNPVTLVLTESGCNSANLLLVEKPCVFDRETKLGTFEGVRIISRIGSQFVVHWHHQEASSTDSNRHRLNDDDQVWHRVILKKSDVVSWAYDFGSKKSSIRKDDTPKMQ